MKNMPQTTLNQWLSYPGSFMERLLEHGVTDAGIQVVFEKFAQATEIEKHYLQLEDAEETWIREVIISSPLTIWMFARTIIPKKTLTGREKELQLLETRSLGSFLFQDKNLQRSAFEFSLIEKNSVDYQKISNYVPIRDQALSSRHSLFITHGKKIFLQEVFFESVGKLK